MGPNGSGKTTFLDVIAFLSDLVRNRGDVRQTVLDRSVTFEKLLWIGAGKQLSVGGRSRDRRRLSGRRWPRKSGILPRVRYEIEVTLNAANEVGLEHETLWLTDAAERESRAPNAPSKDFPNTLICRRVLLVPPGSHRRDCYSEKAGRQRQLLHRGSENRTCPRSSLVAPSRLWRTFPQMLESFPVSIWFRDLLEKGVQTLALNGHSNPPAESTGSRPSVPDRTAQICRGSSTAFDDSSRVFCSGLNM